MVKTFDDLRDENKGKCNLDMNDILLAFCLIHGAINDRKNNFFLSTEYLNIHVIDSH